MAFKLSLYSVVCFSATIVYLMYGIPAYLSPEKFANPNNKDIPESSNFMDFKWMGIEQILLAIYCVVCGFATGDSVKKGVIVGFFIGGTVNIVAHLIFWSPYSRGGIITTIAFWPFMAWILYTYPGGICPCCDGSCSGTEKKKKTSCSSLYKYVLGVEILMTLGCAAIYGFFHEEVWKSSGNEEILPFSSFDNADGTPRRGWNWAGIAMINMGVILAPMIFSKDVLVQRMVMGAIILGQLFQAFNFFIDWLPSAMSVIVMGLVIISMNGIVLVRLGCKKKKD